METIKILFPYDGIEEKELKERIESIEGCSIDFEGQSNLDAEIVCMIAISLPPAIKATVDIIRDINANLVKRRVTILDSDNNIVKKNVKLENITE